MVAIIGHQYCLAPLPIDLAIVRHTPTHGNFVVTDKNGNNIFKVERLHSIPARRLLQDAAGNHIVTLRQKIVTLHSRWEVFRGDSTDHRDLLFSAKKSSLVSPRTKLEVFLAKNTAEEVSDFTVQQSFLKQSCDIYAGGSSRVIAKMQKKHTPQSILLGKDKFMVKVYPNTDSAFIVALVAILDEINNSSHGLLSP